MQGGLALETASDFARYRIFSLQDAGVDLPRYDSQARVARRRAASDHTGVSGVSTGPSEEFPTIGEDGNTANSMVAHGPPRHRRRTKVFLTAEQKQLKRLRRRKRELEALTLHGTPTEAEQAAAELSVVQEQLAQRDRVDVQVDGVGTLLAEI